MLLPSILLTLSAALPLDRPPADAGEELGTELVFSDGGVSVVVPEDIELNLEPLFEVRAVSPEENAAREAAERARREAAELAERVEQLRASGLVVSDSGWVRPISSGDRFTSGYGSRGAIPEAGVGAMFHNGIDLAAPAGTKLRAPHTGTITHSGWGHRGNTGWAVEITLEDGTAVMYNHMLVQSPLEVGSKVKAGDVVGEVGSTGNSSGPHVHLSVWRGEDHIHPEEFFSEHGISLR